MVRKQTWILLIIFALLLGATFYLQKNPLPAGTSAALTPSATTAPKLLQGWESSAITSMELNENQGRSIQIAQDKEGNWTLGNRAAGDGAGKEKVDTGMAEQLRTEIAEMRPIAMLPANYQLDAVGLNAPARTLTIGNNQGKQITINIGSMDPTGSGYYVQITGQAPAVVNKTTLDGIVDLFNKALPTPAPEQGTPTVDQNLPTKTPSP